MTDQLGRRDIFKIAGGMAAGAFLGSSRLAASARDATVSEHGAVVAANAGSSARVGHDILTKGGNAADAVVAAALAACVLEPSSCGIAGYGLHVTVAQADGKVTCIDGDSMAPQAARADMFEADQAGQVPGKTNYYGWLAADVPGTLAGLDFALDRCGTKKFADVVAPAIAFARDGFEVNERVANSIRQAAPHLEKDAASKRIYFRDGKPLQPGDTYRNPDLAAMLEKLAEPGAADSFYRGDIGRHIASEFQKHGGIVTADDFAAYQAKEVAPVKLHWREYSVHTAPLCAGGASSLQALSILKALGWEGIEDRGERNHAALEALRLAWKDRFQYFGDPDHVEVPMDRLLWDGYAQQLAGQVRQAVKNRKPIELQFDSYDQTGTVHISAADSEGNLAALTLTHGGGFGARVTVEGLGLTLGHGISRFDPRPGFANSIAPRKRPLNNMSPTVVLRGRRPVLALGGRGGRRIPNAVFSVLLWFMGEDQPMAESINGPRMHTEGGMKLTLDDRWSSEDAAYFKKLGYEPAQGSVAYVSAASFDLQTHKAEAAHR